jgi:hypothetical protein
MGRKAVFEGRFAGRLSSSIFPQDGVILTAASRIPFLQKIKVACHAGS